MTLLKFTKNISCENSSNCALDIVNKLEKNLNIVLMAKTPTDKVNGHLSIQHTNGEHLIFLFLYSKNGISEHHDIKTQTVKTVINKRVIKHAGNIPTIEQIKKLI